MNKQSISVVIPAHNEEGNIIPLVNELHRELANREYEIILINDGSTDNTLAEIEQCQKEDEDHVILIDFRICKGKQNALLAGYEKAGFPLVLTLDGDLQDDPSFISQMEKVMEEENADAVVAQRTSRSEPYYRKLLQKIFSFLIFMRFKVRFNDVNSPFRLVKSKLIKGLQLRHGEFRFFSVIWSQAGYKVVETPVTQRPRGSGVSKFLGWSRYFEAIFILWTIPPNVNGQKKKRRILPAIVTLALLYLIWYLIDVKTFINALKSIPVWLVVVLSFLNLIVLMIKSERWRAILKGWKIKYDSQKAFRAYLIGVFLGMATPMRLGNLARSAYVVRDANAPLSTALTSVLMDRILDLGILVVISIPVLMSFFSLDPIVVIVSMATVILVSAAIVSPIRVHPEHGIMLKSSIVGRREDSYSLGNMLFPAVILTFLAYVVVFFLAWILAGYLEINISFWQLIPALATVNIVTTLPITIAGVGTRELAYVAVLRTYGVSDELAVLFALTNFFCFYLSTSIFGAVALMVDKAGDKKQKANTK